MAVVSTIVEDFFCQTVPRPVVRPHRGLTTPRCHFFPFSSYSYTEQAESADNYHHVYYVYNNLFFCRRPFPYNSYIKKFPGTEVPQTVQNASDRVGGSPTPLHSDESRDLCEDPKSQALPFPSYSVFEKVHGGVVAPRVGAQWPREGRVSALRARRRGRRVAAERLPRPSDERRAEVAHTKKRGRCGSAVADGVSGDAGGCGYE